MCFHDKTIPGGSLWKIVLKNRRKRQNKQKWDFEAVEEIKINPKPRKGKKEEK